MKPIQTSKVAPSVPAGLEGLRELAFNLRWAWDYPTVELSRRLDADLCEASGHNPLLVLESIPQARLETAATDPGFVAQLARVQSDLRAYAGAQSTWFRRTHGGEPTPLAPAVQDGEGRCIYEAGSVACSRRGLFGFTFRILPHHPDLGTPFQPGIIAWAE